ncbi:MAG: ribosome silencing factor [Legionellales bacterium]|nr:ribosome silencing factor [Legionellales bacterium]
MADKNTLLNLIIVSLNDIKALDITVIDVSLQTTITDVMVICTGRSSRHVKSIAEHITEQCKTAGWRAISQQGLLEGDWALVDFGDVVVHIMQPESRTFYNLEELWQNPSP